MRGSVIEEVYGKRSVVKVFGKGRTGRKSDWERMAEHCFGVRPWSSEGENPIGEVRSAGRLEADGRIHSMGLDGAVVPKEVEKWSVKSIDERQRAYELGMWLSGVTGKPVDRSICSEVEMCRKITREYWPLSMLRWADVDDRFLVGYVRGYLHGLGAGVEARESTPVSAPCEWYGEKGGAR